MIYLIKDLPEGIGQYWLWDYSFSFKKENDDLDDWTVQWFFTDDYMAPNALDWPFMECYYEMWSFPNMCEYTVQRPMIQTLFMTGFLGARY